MAKTFKQYNAETKEWVRVNGSDITVIQELSGDTNIVDTNVIVTNVNYNDGDEDVTLSDALDGISQDITKLKRNVSWLAEHGGGGGGQGGGGGTSSYGIVLTSPVGVANGGAYYTEETTLYVKFMITGVTGEYCRYYYQYDTTTSENTELVVDKEVMVKLDLTAGNAKSHTFIIKATNPSNGTIAPFSFTIYRSNLTIKLDTTSQYYNNGIMQIPMRSNGSIPLIMSNGLVGSTTTFHVSFGTDVNKTLPSFPNQTANDQKYTFSFWDIIPESSIIPGNDYPLKIYCEARLSNVHTQSSTIDVRVRVINPDALTLTMGINGEASSSEPIEASLNSILNYNFRSYAPQNYKRMYYATMVEKSNGERILLEGDYYDEELHTPEATYASNPTSLIGSTVSSTYAISAGEYQEGDTFTIHVKAWAYSSVASAEVKITGISQEIRVIDTNSEIFDRQIPNRTSTTSKDTMFASWNRFNANSNNPNLWVSKQSNYNPLVNEGYDGVTLNLNVFNGNADSGVQKNENPPYLRLQNRAYASVDLTEYASEIAAMTNQEEGGFVISLTMNADRTSNVNKTVFQWGTNDGSTGDLAYGIRVDADKIYWRLANAMYLSCNVSQGSVHTVDFVFDTELQVAKIYLNGVMNVAIDITGKLREIEDFPLQMYFGARNTNGEFSNFSDSSIYDFSIYTSVLNDLELAINGKNARIMGRTDDQGVLADYNAWKVKNFISVDSFGTITSPFNSTDTEFDINQINNIATNSSIPTMVLNFANGGNFTKQYFLQPHGKNDIAKYSAVMDYYDPDTKGKVENMNVDVELQGTSTLSYRIKNLEIYTKDTVIIDGIEMPVLFQPKKTWFPEAQFTLKADVVDSAHANNAVIGEWINNSSLFTPTPPMTWFNESTRPKEVDPEGNTRTHQIDGGTAQIDYDENVTIKHTLEGFPFLLFIHFDGEVNFTFVGIYSFNLGRYSVYNMGMNFLSCFSRGVESNTPTPRKIEYYKTTHTLGTINISDVKSFEFDNPANSNDPLHPCWTQYDRSVVNGMGEYKYPFNVGDTTSEPSFNNLCRLFNQVAQSKISYTTKYDGIYQYTGTVRKDDGGLTIEYSTTHSAEPTPQTADYYDAFNNTLNIDNAVAYFVVANAFGMTDSLAKNLTLRTWDNGQTWYTCFYDMDTALGLSNTGTEDIPTFAAIDKVENGEDGVNITYHDSLNNAGYSGYLSKLWGLIRETAFIKQINNNDPTDLYTKKWAEARVVGGDLASINDFVEIVKSRVATCGELIYDADYSSKYIVRDEFGAQSSTSFLHGTRVEFIKKWLTDHVYFLDGYFDVKQANIAGIFEDSPLYNDVFAMAFSPDDGVYPKFRIRSVSPTFVKLSVGSPNGGQKFYIDGTQEQEITVKGTFSTNTQLYIHGSTLLTLLNGISEGFRQIRADSTARCLQTLESFNVAGAKQVQSNTFDPLLTIVKDENGVSQLEAFDAAGLKASDPTSEIIVNLGGLTKVMRIDISNSDVTSIVMPDSSLEYLNVTNSQIKELQLSNQNKLSNININGCNKLQKVGLSYCNNIEGITVQDKASLSEISLLNNGKLTGITVSNCPELVTLNVDGNTKLKTVNVEHCPKLKTLNITNNDAIESVTILDCVSKNLTVTITSENSSLKSLNIKTTDSPNAFILPKRACVTSITALTFESVANNGYIRYADDAEMEEYGDGYVVDLSPMTSLNGRNLTFKNTGIQYLRVKNDPSNAFDLYPQTFPSSNGLRRVFGHLNLHGNVFSEKTEFYVNHDSQMLWIEPNGPNGERLITNYNQPDFTSEEADTNRYFVLNHPEHHVYMLDGIYPQFVDSPTYTNIQRYDSTITSLDGWFSRTNCDIYDVYYLLSLCDDNIVSLANMFNGCQSVNTLDYRIETLQPECVENIHFLDVNTFKKCRNVTNINNLFAGCNIIGPLFQPLLEPLVLNLEDFSYVFSGLYFIDWVTGFFPANNRIKRIAGFNPNIRREFISLVTVESIPSQLLEYFLNRSILGDTVVFNNLGHLETFEDSFNMTEIDFQFGHPDATELFFGLVNLKVIRDSFNKLYGHGCLGNLFGGMETDSARLAQYPHGITHILHAFNFMGGDCSALRGDDTIEKVVLPLGNSFFKNIAGSIQYVSGNLGDNSTYDDVENGGWGNGGSSFCGPGLFKVIANFDSDNSLMEEDCNGEDFPYEILKGCYYLRECPSLFEGCHNLKDSEDGSDSDIEINLFYNRNGVSMFNDNTRLTNVSKMFRNMSSSISVVLKGDAFKTLNGLVNVEYMLSGINLKGSIPFHLFYQETQASNTVNGLTHAQAVAAGISGDAGTLDSMPADYSTRTNTYKTFKKTIKNMKSVLMGIGNVSTNAKPYSLTGQTEFEKYAVCENPNYSDFEYVIYEDGGELKYKRNTDTYTKAWDEYAFDGTNAFIGCIGLYNAGADKNNYPYQTVENQSLAKDVMSEITGYNIRTDADSSKFLDKNYFCPPDIFRYCEDDPSSSIDNALNGVSGKYDNGVFNGVYGRIPENIFKPVSNFVGVAGAIGGNKLLFPPKWGTSDSDLQNTYPLGLISEMPAIEDISGLFAGNVIWKWTKFTKQMFPSNNRIGNIDSLFDGTLWIERSDTYQLDPDIFSVLPTVQYARRTFSSPQNNYCLYSVSSQMFGNNIENNKFLRDVSYIFYHCSDMTGSVPYLWNVPSITGTKAFVGVDFSENVQIPQSEYDKIRRDWLE